MAGSGSDVRHIQQQVGKKLLLNAKAPLLDARRLRKRLDSKHERCISGQRIRLKHLVDDREVAGSNQLRSPRRVARKVKPGIRNRWGMENPGAAPNDRFVMTPAGRPGKPKTRRPVGPVG